MPQSRRAKADRRRGLLPLVLIGVCIEAHIREWTCFAEADAANCSLTASGDQRSREATAMFDQIARTLTTTIERN